MKRQELIELAYFLDEIGLDQIELAEMLKVSKDSVSRWCRNVTQPSLKNLRKIAELGHVDVRSLLEPTIYTENGPSPIEEYLDNKAKSKKPAGK